MIKATIYTETREINVKCGDNVGDAISRLQDSVSGLRPEDGRCRFVVYDGYTELCSWSYQPTFREIPERKVRAKKEPRYTVTSIIFILLNGKELDYDNFYADGESFDTARQARAFMKERGYRDTDYRLVYEYTCEDARTDGSYGFGRGFTRAEAKEDLNRALAYYSLYLDKYGKIKDTTSI